MKLSNKKLLLLSCGLLTFLFSLQLSAQDLSVTININSYVSPGGANDGSLTANATGGTLPYSFLWSNGANTATTDELVPGTYTSWVTDASSTTVETVIILTEAAPPVFSSSPITAVNENTNYTYNITTSDANNDEVTVTATVKPDWLSLNTVSTTSTFAGSGSSTYAEGTGEAASFGSPYAMVVDASDNIYLSTYSQLILKITPAGEVSTFAGSGEVGYNNATGTAATFNSPSALAMDASGNLFVADFSNQLIRKITPAGVVSTFAGMTGQRGVANGIGTAASFSGPIGMTIDASGNLYVIEVVNNLIRKITPAGEVSTFAGSGSSALVDGTGIAASFSSPTSIAIDASGNLYVTEQNSNSIRKITPGAVVTTIAGTGSAGSDDGEGLNASFNAPYGIFVDDANNVFVSEINNHTIRKITPSGVVSTIAGTSLITGSANGVGTTASFNGPVGMAMTSSGDLYVADLWNNLIRKIDLNSYSLSGDPTGQVGDHNVTLSASDGYGGTATQPFIVTVTDVTNPVFTSATAANFVENGTGTAHTVIATDANTLSYNLGSGNDETLFDIVTGTGVVTFKSAPDFENPTDADANNAYVINVVASDGTNAVNQNVIITVINVDDSDPVFTSATTASFIENETGTAYTVIATDANTLTYSLGSGNDESLFDIVAISGVVTFKTTPDFENPSDADANNTYVINVVANDGTNSVNQDVTIAVTNVDDTNPVFTSATAADFTENGTATAYTVVATDANTLTYSLGSGNDEALFDITASTGIVTFKLAPDFENPTDGDANNTYVINVIANDGINAVNQDVTITITDVDEIDPVFTSAASVNFAENGTVTAYTVIATDANTLTYSLGTGNDEALFDMAGSTGLVTFKTIPDFENPTDGDANNTYVINVIASDGTNTVNQDVTITVTDVDDTAPVFTSVTSVDFDENGIGTAYTAIATDANTLTYNFGTGNDETLFDMVSSTGVVTFKSIPDFENPVDSDGNNTYVINVMASDGSNAVNQTVTITVINVTTLEQTITFAKLVEKSVDSDDFELTASASSGLTVTYTSSDENVATISGSTVNIVGGGTTTITALQEGGDDFAAARSIQQTLVVNKLEQFITFDPIDDQLLENISLKLIATASSALEVSFTVISGPATIVGDEITFTDTGMITVSASQTGNESFLAAMSLEQSFEITAVTGVEGVIESSISVYPNPVTNRLNVDTGNEKLVRIDIRDLTGKLVITEFNPIAGVDVNHLNAGNYFIQLVTVHRTITQHLMKR